MSGPLNLTAGPVASQFIDAVATGKAREAALFGPRGEGKALENNTPVLTPIGWMKISDLKVGDSVISVDGTPAKVKGVYPQGALPLYRIKFSDRTSVLCTDDHLWAVETKWDRAPRVRRRNKRGLPEKPRHRRTEGWIVRNAATIRQKIESNAWARGGRWSIPLVAPIKFPERVVPLDPWLMGALLGDGGFTNGGVTFTTADREVAQTVLMKLPFPVKLRQRSAIDYALTMGNIGGLSNPVLTALRKLGLDGHYSYEKFVPAVYLYNSAHVRLNVLRGLLDTDGTILKHSNSVSFSSSSQRLAANVEFLVRSLGGVSTRQKPKVAKLNGVEKRLSYKVTISLPKRIVPFTLLRKARIVRDKQQRGMPRRFIVGCEREGEGEATCIAVDHPSNLFVTQDFIVTHNTQSAALAVATHAKYHELAGFKLPVPWMCIAETFQTHKDKTIPSLEEDHWQGAWQFFEDKHKAVFKTNKEAAVVDLFGIEDAGAIDRVRRGTCGMWAEEVAPATSGPGVPENAWSFGLTSQRVPSHCKPAFFTSNLPEPSHWSWKRFKPIKGMTVGSHPDHPKRMYFRIPKGENKYISQADRDEWRDALSDRPDLIARLLDGEPGVVQIGRAVATQFIEQNGILVPVGFNEAKHVSPTRLKPVKGVPFHIGQDGGHCPVTTISQQYNGRLYVYAALVVDGGMRQQYEFNVIPWFKRYAPGAILADGMIRGTYDPSMPDDESDSDRNPIDVIRELLGGWWEPGPVSWDSRKDAMLRSFNKVSLGTSFDPWVIIDPIDCEELIDALRSRWYYPEDRFGNISSDKPKKPCHPHEDLGDSYCYMACSALPEFTREKPKDQGRQFSRFDARFHDDPRFDNSDSEDRFDPRLS